MVTKTGIVILLKIHPVMKAAHMHLAVMKGAVDNPGSIGSLNNTNEDDYNFSIEGSDDDDTGLSSEKIQRRSNA